MDVAKVTARGQLILPKRIRARLRVQEGDLVAFSLENDAVVVRRLPGGADGYLTSVESTLSEWHSPEDEKAWRDL